MIVKKLQEKSIQYTINHDVDEMTKLGFTSLPVLNNGHDLLDFSGILKWLKEGELDKH